VSRCQDPNGSIIVFILHLQLPCIDIETKVPSFGIQTEPLLFQILFVDPLSVGCSLRALIPIVEMVSPVPIDVSMEQNLR
jgi:hypothetical protein